MSFSITNHAVERYIERVRPALEIGPARTEMTRLARDCGIRTTEPPDWVASHDIKIQRGQEVPDSYIDIGNTGIVFVLYKNTMVTVLTRAGMGSTARQTRNAKKAEQRRIKRQGRRQFLNHKTHKLEWGEGS